jgi:endonuclease/exonuclease/phosphatase family metal-dependent hydrolase
MAHRALAVAAAVLLAAACSVRSYLDPARPFYATRHGVPRDPEPALRVVTFNVKEGRRVAAAAAALAHHRDLRNADIVVLQEMNAEAVDAVATALRMNSAYFPATREPGGPDWGNAVLSPWPIEGERKVLLPHLGRVRRRARTATRAVVRLPSGAVRVYSTHLGSPWDTSEASRRDQVRAILDDAEASPAPVIVAGDFNSEKVGALFEGRGYCWPTRGAGPSVHGYSVDHVFVRGLCAARGMWAGVARDVTDASDHRPVWAVLQGRKILSAPPDGLRLRPSP